MSQHPRRPSGQACFSCISCRTTVPLSAFGTRHRNHCPACLWSRHVDEQTGDRRAACGQPMTPIAVVVDHNGEWSILHRCTGCGRIRLNRIAGDDSELALLTLALRPLANPAFPLDRFPGPTDRQWS